MKRLDLVLCLAAGLFGFGACKKQVSNNDAIRAGILQHLTAIGTLNMSAMDMDVRSVSINGNQAHAEVAWVVLKTESLGGMIQHPNPGQNPHTNPDVHSGALPNFNEIMNPSGAPAQGALPPGRPQVNSPQQTKPQPGGQSQTSSSKP